MQCNFSAFPAHEAWAVPEQYERGFSTSVHMQLTSRMWHFIQELGNTDLISLAGTHIIATMMRWSYSHWVS